MPAQQQAPVAARTMPEFCALAGLGDDAKALLRPEHGPRAFVGVLTEQNQHPDAVRFIAHALPKREAIWWAWVCARRASGESPAPQIAAALAATEKWVTQPTDDNRRAAMRAAEAATFATPAGCTALAVFLSGGSLGPPDTPPVPPGELMTAKAVAGAVIASAVHSEPEKAPDKFRAFVAQGLDVVDKLKLWGPQ